MTDIILPGKSPVILVQPGQEPLLKASANRRLSSRTSSGGSTVRVTSNGTWVEAPVEVPPVDPPPPPPPPPPPIDPVPPTSGYDVEFRPNTADETGRFTNFLNQTAGKRRAVYGDVPVTWIKAVMTGGVLDFLNGARIKAIDDRAQATLGFYGSTGVAITDASVEGRGYGTYYADKQWQHGLAVYGGSGLTFLRPKTRNTFGDGMDVDVMGSEPTATAIRIIDPDFQRSCRNNLTLNAGQGTVEATAPGKAKLLYAGLHNIDLEPNGDREALSLDWVLTDLELGHHDNFPVRDPGSPDIVGFALAGGGYSHAMKKRIEIRRCHADRFDLAVGFAQKFIFVGNKSDVAIGQGATRFYDRNGSNEIHDNVNIALVEYPFF